MFLIPPCLAEQTQPSLISIYFVMPPSKCLSHRGRIEFWPCQLYSFCEGKSERGSRGYLGAYYRAWHTVGAVINRKQSLKVFDWCVKFNPDGGVEPPSLPRAESPGWLDRDVLTHCRGTVVPGGSRTSPSS